jgi:hypothetical protein
MLSQLHLLKLVKNNDRINKEAWGTKFIQNTFSRIERKKKFECARKNEQKENGSKSIKGLYSSRINLPPIQGHWPS